MNRSVKVSLSAATVSKLRRLEALRREIRSCTQAYVNSLWITSGKLDGVTLNRIVSGSLSHRHRANCLRTALNIVTTAQRLKSKRAPIINGAIQLSGLVAKIERGKGSFDYVLKISSLTPRNLIVIPFKSHTRLNYWLTRPNARLLQGCTLGDTWAGLWIEIPDQPAKLGRMLAVDIGVNKLLVDSNGAYYGTEIKTVCHRVNRCKPGSKGRLRANRARKDYINREVKKLPWTSLGILGVENLKGLKFGKKLGRGKAFRKALAPWTYRQVLTRIKQLAQENRVCLVAVNPQNTSRQCPHCEWVAKENRVGEKFRCVRCNYSADADFVGATNILIRTTGQLRGVYGPSVPLQQSN